MTSGSFLTIPKRSSQRAHARRRTRAQLAEDARAGGEGGGDRVELARDAGAIEPARLGDERGGRVLGVAEDLAVAARDRGDRAAHEPRLVLQDLARRREDELGVGGRAVVVDAELARLRALGAQRDALDVPEARRGGDAPGQQARHGGEADRGRADLVRIAPGAGDDRAQHGVVARQARDADAPALEVARGLHARLGEDRRQRLLDERHDADEVAAALARDREVVDVEDREVGAPGDEQLDRVRRVRRHADAQVDAQRVVIAALDGGVDARVHGVWLEVQQQRRGAVGRGLLAVGAAARERQAGGGEQQREEAGAAHDGDEDTAAAGRHRPGARAVFERFREGGSHA